MHTDKVRLARKRKSYSEPPGVSLAVAACTSDGIPSPSNLYLNITSSLMQMMTNVATYAARVVTGKTEVERASATTPDTAVPKIIPEAISPVALEHAPSAASDDNPSEVRPRSRYLHASTEKMDQCPSQNTPVIMSELRTKSRRNVPRPIPSLRERYERKKEQLGECAAELDQSRLAYDALKRELRIERDKSQKLALQRDELNIKLSESSNNLESERRLRTAADDLLSKRSAELDATKALLPATESITDTRIVDLFRDLNYEIAQSATTLAEAYEDATRHTRTSVKIQPDVKACFEACGALPLLRLPPKSAVDPTTALQIGFQAALVTFTQAFLDGGVYQNAQGVKLILVALKDNGTCLRKACYIELH